MTDLTRKQWTNILTFRSKRSHYKLNQTVELHNVLCLIWDSFLFLASVTSWSWSHNLKRQILVLWKLLEQNYTSFLVKFFLMVETLLAKLTKHKYKLFIKLLRKKKKRQHLADKWPIQTVVVLDKKWIQEQQGS